MSEIPTKSEKISFKVSAYELDIVIKLCFRYFQVKDKRGLLKSKSDKVSLARRIVDNPAAESLLAKFEVKYEYYRNLSRENGDLTAKVTTARHSYNMEEDTTKRDEKIKLWNESNSQITTVVEELKSLEKQILALGQAKELEGQITALD